MPDVPAGTTQPCCQPLTATGVSRVPALVCATQPGLRLSGTTSSRDVAASVTRTSRWAAPHAPVAGVMDAAVVVGDSAASGPDNCAPSTTNCGPGLINSSC